MCRDDVISQPRGQSLRATGLWLAGFGLFAAGDVVNLMGLNMAAQSLLEALGSIQFVSNLIFSSLLLKEKLSELFSVGAINFSLGLETINLHREQS